MKLREAAWVQDELQFLVKPSPMQSHRGGAFAFGPVAASVAVLLSPDAMCHAPCCISKR